MPQDVEYLKETILQVLQNIHTEKMENNLKVDMWCHFGRSCITGVDEGASISDQQAQRVRQMNTACRKYLQSNSRKFIEKERNRIGKNTEQHNAVYKTSLFIVCPSHTV